MIREVKGDWAGPQPAQAPSRCTKYNSPPINGQRTNFILFDVAIKLPLPFKGLNRLRYHHAISMRARYGQKLGRVAEREWKFDVSDVSVVFKMLQNRWRSQDCAQGPDPPVNQRGKGKLGGEGRKRKEWMERK